MLPVVARPGETRRQILLYWLLLAPVGDLPWLLGHAGPVYRMISVAAGAALAALALRVRRETGTRSALLLDARSAVLFFLLGST